MSHDKKFENESQDARRRDEHNKVHPDDKIGKKHDNSQQDSRKTSDSQSRKK